MESVEFGFVFMLIFYVEFYGLICNFVFKYGDGIFVNCDFVVLGCVNLFLGLLYGMFVGVGYLVMFVNEVVGV